MFFFELFYRIETVHPLRRYLSRTKQKPCQEKPKLDHYSLKEITFADKVLLSLTVDPLKCTYPIPKMPL